MGITNYLDRVFYPSYKDNWDDSLFRDRILPHLSEQSQQVLDLGAGAGVVQQMNFRGIAGTVAGIDPDPRVRDNPFLDQGLVATGGNIPYNSNQFDVIFADNVLEHLEHPLTVFGEVHRVLKPGGVFLVKTPNKYHYMPCIARCTPHRFHQFVNRLRGRDSEDTFPTLYRANTRAKLQQLAREAQFEVSYIELFEGRPEYLRHYAVPYVGGIIYEKIVNTFPLFEQFRILLIAELRKKQST